MFVGYAPAQHPEIAVSVIVEHGGGGGSNAAPVAKRVMDLYFAKQRGETISPLGDTETETAVQEAGERVEQHESTESQ